MVHAGNFKFRHIPVHAGYDLVIVVFADFGIVHIPAGKLLRENFVKDIVLIQGDCFVDSTLGVGLRRNHCPFPDFTQGRGQGKELALQSVIVLEAVVSPGGIEHPVSDIYKV